MRSIESIRRTNLGNLIKEYKTISALAAKIGTAPSYISQIMTFAPSSTGRARNLGSELARKIEVACMKPIGWVDIEHPEGGEEIAEEAVPTQPRIVYYNNIRELDPNKFTPMKFYNNTSVYGGAGEESQENENFFEMPFRNYFYITREVNPDRCRMFRIRGKSMEPAYKDNGVVAVNLDMSGIIDGEPYLIRHHTLSVKYLSIRGEDGALIIKSENNDKTTFPNVVIPYEEASQIEVIGRVFWNANG